MLRLFLMLMTLCLLVTPVSAEEDYIPHIDFRDTQTKDGHKIGLADIELVAATESQRVFMLRERHSRTKSVLIRA